MSTASTRSRSVSPRVPFVLGTLLAILAALTIWPTMAQAQTTQPITETGTGTQTLTSRPGCQNGGQCTSELEGSIAGDPITNPDATGEDAGTNATFTADYSQVEPGPSPGTFCVPTTGTATLTYANGSTLELDVEGDYTGDNNGTGPLTFTGTFTVTGGTGNFADATGSGDLTATSQGATFTSELDGTLILTDECTITGTDGDDTVRGGVLWYPPTGRRATFTAEFVDRFSGGLLIEHSG